MVRSEKWDIRKNTMNFSDQKKLKVLLLTWEYPPHIVGGLARHTEGLSRYLNKNGVEVHIVTTKVPNLENQSETVNGVFVHRVEPLNAIDHQFLNWIGGLNLAMTQKVMELSAEHKYDLIHAHDWLVGEAAQTIAKELHLPLITTIHATEHGRNAGIYTELQQFIHQKEDRLITLSEHVIVCSEFMKAEVNKIFNCPTGKITVIPNGIHMEKESFTNIDHLHPILQNENRSIIFSIGRLVREKGFDLIIEAAAKMNRKDLCFVIAGVGPKFHEYEQLIKKYNLENDVFLIGFISDKQRDTFFENCKMAVFPSRYEPFGIVALEAMKFSCPIVVSNTGGLRGINKHLETGLFMEPDQVSSLVEQIEFILNEPMVTEEMAENGKILVSHLYSWKRVAELTKRIYEELNLLYSIDEKIYDLYHK
jgi:glycosyltransferase involved in cell wall biosynthesis